ncbi:hypothetical protein PROFUN_13800 [Planoprotostelium fungivorum]|uniref:Selenoprotein F/M domain-containing protein n=1 Tax=Planoprotostelium fungivorum TaxID=1890364 RepID=A0A2P6N354_9EUKA|nr:hypothetical protein PROFUN_13800 [Planoprotostelium fungivorum]
MRGRTASLLVVIAIYCLSASVVVAEQSCLELGFDHVSCSKCEDLKTFVKDAKQHYTMIVYLVAIDSPNLNNSFAEGKLIICKWKVERYPHIETFINRNAKDFPRLQVEVTALQITLANTHQYRAYSDPTLQLVNSEGTVESLKIDGWKTEHLVEYLRDNLP